MKTIALMFATLFLLTTAEAQYDFNDSARAIKACNYISRLIEKDSVQELSTLVRYPLERPNPLPDIKTPKQFIRYYPVLFDSGFKQMFKDFKPTAENIINQGGRYGLIDGTLWIDENDGDIDIIAINYSSAAEIKMKEKIETKAKNDLYAGLKPFSENFIVGETDKYIFRVDFMKDGFTKYERGTRYASWHRGHSMSEKPDIVLTNGTWEDEGSGGWWGVKFKNNDWTYEIEDSPVDGYHLNLFFKEEQKSHSAFKQIK